MPRSPRAAVTRYGKIATIGAAAITCLGAAPSVSGPAALGIIRRQAARLRSARRDGHGMILIERRVNIENATYRVTE
jgi:hypothetical protein